MKSLRELYKIGHGPSSSHTMGPQVVAKRALNDYEEATKFEVTLYGSLALTGKGHLTDFIIKETLKEKEVEIIWKKNETLKYHTNAMQIKAFKESEILGKLIAYSIGGGEIIYEGEEKLTTNNIYPHINFEEIKNYCKKKSIDLYQYVLEYEDNDILEYIKKVYDQMVNSIKAGLNNEGVLKGGINLLRKAKKLYEHTENDKDLESKETNYINAYALAVNEENANANKVVTAPTCGASGTMPAILYYFEKHKGYSKDKIYKGLIVGGLIGNLIKENASISGAEAGCQAEVGTACAMTAAAINAMKDYNIDCIEYSAEVAIEHNLGLTCDPVKGLVQIPCIERNAIASNKALIASRLAQSLIGYNKISLDVCIETMYQTGIDLQSKYRETSKGGLAKFYKEDYND